MSSAKWFDVLNDYMRWTKSTMDASSPQAVLFGVHVGGHLFIEILLVVAIVFLLSQKSYKPPKRPLTEKEIDELCEEWVPDPLIPPIPKDLPREHPILESAAGPRAIIHGKEVLNFACANYLGLTGHDKLLESCIGALEKYGFGSCGPRGFYGTIDVHLDCEARIAKFLGTPDSILYSYGLSTMFSTIPCFCKKGDIIVVDEGVHWGIQNGLQLSRSTIVYFRHNDMDSLQKSLEKIISSSKRAKKLRRYIVVEAIYQNSGKIAPLDVIVQLKEKYRFRLLLDESNSIGVLGGSGRGITEHFDVPVDKIDIITAAMGHALASEGGFCTGSSRVIDHQRLSSSGYVFSASLPPCLATAAITALNVLEDKPDLVKRLKDNISTLRHGLLGLQGLSLSSDPESPLVFLKLENSLGSPEDDMRLLDHIAAHALEESLLVAITRRSTLDRCTLPLGIKMLVSAGHRESDLLRACDTLKAICSSVLDSQSPISL